MSEIMNLNTNMNLNAITAMSYAQAVLLKASLKNLDDDEAKAFYEVIDALSKLDDLVRPDVLVEEIANTEERMRGEYGRATPAKKAALSTYLNALLGLRAYHYDKD